MNFTQISPDNLKIPLPVFNYNDNTWIAGGAVRDSLIKDTISDIDIFGKSKEALAEFSTNNKLDDRYDVVHDTADIKTYRNKTWKIQLILKHNYNTIQDCLDDFDYTICQFAFMDNKVFCNPDSLVHLHNKQLIINKLRPDYTINSFRRLQKYIQRGYTICDGGLKTLTEKMRELTPEQVKNNFEYYADGKARVVRFD